MTSKYTELPTGKIKINEDVYATIVMMAATEVKGVHGMHSTFNDGVSHFFGVRHDSKGVKVSFSESGTISVTVYVSISYGYRIPDVALRLQERIKTALVDYTDIEVESVDIVVQDIIFEDLVAKSQVGE